MRLQYVRPGRQWEPNHQSIRVSDPEVEARLSMAMGLSRQRLSIAAVASLPRVPFCDGRDPPAVLLMPNPLYEIKSGLGFGAKPVEKTTPSAVERRSHLLWSSEQ